MTLSDENNERERQLGVALLSDVMDRLRKSEPINLDTSLRKVLAGLAGTALNRLGAIRELLNIGALAESAILARTLVELQISAAYLTSAEEQMRETRANRFLAFELRQRNEMLKRTLLESPESTFVKPGTLGEQRLQEIRQSFEEACGEFERLEKSKNWADLTYAKMIQAISDAHVQDELLFVYQHVYFWFSEYAHPTPTGVRHVLPLIESPEQKPVLLQYAVPLFSSIATTHLCGYAAVAGDKVFVDTSDLIIRFTSEMPRITCS